MNQHDGGCKSRPGLSCFFPGYCSLLPDYLDQVCPPNQKLGKEAAQRVWMQKSKNRNALRQSAPERTCCQTVPPLDFLIRLISLHIVEAELESFDEGFKVKRKNSFITGKAELHFSAALLEESVQKCLWVEAECELVTHPAPPSRLSRGLGWLSVWIVPLFFRVLVVRSLNQGAVTSAASAAGIFVRQLHGSAVVLALPQAGRLDDLLHQLLKRTLNAILCLCTRL